MASCAALPVGFIDGVQVHCVPVVDGNWRERIRILPQHIQQLLEEARIGRKVALSSTCSCSSSSSCSSCSCSCSCSSWNQMKLIMDDPKCDVGGGGGVGGGGVGGVGGGGGGGGGGEGGRVLRNCFCWMLNIDRFRTHRVVRRSAGVELLNSKRDREQDRDQDRDREQKELMNL